MPTVIGRSTAGMVGGRIGLAGPGRPIGTAGETACAAATRHHFRRRARVRVPLPVPSRSSVVLRRSLPLSYQLFGHVGLPLQPSHVRPRWARSSNPPAEPPCAGKIATWLSKMTLQEIASVRVHDKFQSGSVGEARSWASAVVVIQLGGTRRHVGPRPLPPDGRDRHHRRCE